MHRAFLPLFLLATPALADDTPRTWRGNEVPDYTVERELAPGLEIRSYPSTVMAAVSMDRDPSGGDSSFRRLAGYIFGGNSENTKIAMTSPVISKPARMMQYVSAAEIASAGKSGEWTRAFVLPSEYEMSDLPTPDDGSIRVFEAAPYRVAAIAFLGAGTSSQFEEARKVLAQTLDAQGIAYVPVPEYASYDAPWVPAERKRHEVHYRLEN